MKYFVLGALASGMLLYGMSMIYGATGTLEITEIAQRIADGDAIPTDPGVRAGVRRRRHRLQAGRRAVPHVGAGRLPRRADGGDAVRSAPRPSSRRSRSSCACWSQALGARALLVEWQQMLIVMAVLSLAIGNITAIAQTNLKRMLAYSTISHMGFLLLGILSGTLDGFGAAMFYIVVYVLMSLGTFGMILLLSREGFEAENLEDFKGLNQRSPWYAFMMLLLMFSMAGIPPTVGFYAKLSVLQAVLSAGYIWLAVVAVLFSLVGAFYYLRIVKLMYFDAPTDTAPIAPHADVPRADERERPRDAGARASCRAPLLALCRVCDPGCRCDRAVSAISPKTRSTSQGRLSRASCCRSTRTRCGCPTAARRGASTSCIPARRMILPLLDDGTVLLERQFRYPLRQAFLRAARRQDRAGRDPLETAKRELLEEIGYEAAEWRASRTLHPCIGYSDERIELYLARELEFTRARSSTKASSWRRLRLPLAEALEWVRRAASPRRKPCSACSGPRRFSGRVVGRPSGAARGQARFAGLLLAVGCGRDRAADARRDSPGRTARPSRSAASALPASRPTPRRPACSARCATSFSARTNSRLPSSVARSRMKLPSIFR